MDDGARTLEESLAMVRMAAESGTTDLVLTPHANSEYAFEPDRVAERLAEIVAGAGDCLRLYSGCDFHLNYDNIQDAIQNPNKYTINHKCYLLVEFSELLIFNNTLDIFGRLLDAGMIPVVTHPERNGLLRQRIEQIAKWVDAGSRVQITAQSLLGRFGNPAKEFCDTLLDRGLVHFVASDAHDCEHRPPRLNEAYLWLKKQCGEELAEALCVINPRATLAGEELYEMPSGASSERRKWYQFWR